MAGRKLRFEALYPHGRADVWEALTSSEAIADWLMPNDFKPVVGHRFNFKTKPAPGFDGTVHCEVLTVEPLERLVYSWKGRRHRYDRLLRAQGRRQEHAGGY